MARNLFGIQWHITERCDQRCKHCYIFNGREQAEMELSIDVLKSIVKDFALTCKKVEKTPILTITGGDPLLYPNAWDFFEALKENNIRFSILGNPFHLNENVAKKLKELGCYNYQMSIDGSKDTHDFIRKPGSFDATLKKVKVLNDAGIHTSIMTTVSKLNINEVPDLIPILVKAEVKNFGFARYCPNPDDLNSMVSPEEYKDFLDKMWEVFVKYKDSGTRFALKDHLWKLFLYEKGLFDISYEEDLIVDGCHCGITHMTILPNGTVYACRRCESPIGKVPEQSLYEIFFGEALDAYRQYDRFEKCSKCELLKFCRGCPAVAKCTTGNFYAPDPQCWKK
ncbi:MAG: radical SAM/SPASM domain protein, ACGX system [Clostridia bacterium]